MEAIVQAKGIRLEGFICPPHVSAVVGSRPYQVLAESWGMPCVITGFEPLDILQGIHMLLNQVARKEHEVEVQYRRGVPEKGNLTALKVMEEVFQVEDSLWRGLGDIPKSGLGIREAFSAWDAKVCFGLEHDDVGDPPECRCGEVLRGLLEPRGCKMFGTPCTPRKPPGPCMISGEGACAAHFKYGQATIKRQKRLP